MGAMDPHAVLGLDPGASIDEAGRAYRELAKRWHPDRAGDEGAAKMIELNVALELLRSAQRPGSRLTVRPPGSGAAAKGPVLGGWLPEAIRRALGRELLDALERDEPVELVTPAATWASPSTLLAVTDRRLLWLLDDALVTRVHSLAYRNVSDVQVRKRRKGATLTVHTLGGRRHVFHDLRLPTAQTIASSLTATVKT